MKTILSVMAGTALAVGCLPATASAATSSQTINQRQHEQQLRIRQGVRSGELTRREAARLEAREAKIRRDERHARADGRITPRERRHLNRELNHTSRRIYRQKHDNQTRH
jgi:hypothetical protein